MWHNARRLKLATITKCGTGSKQASATKFSEKISSDPLLGLIRGRVPAQATFLKYLEVKKVSHPSLVQLMPPQVPSVVETAVGPLL